MIFQFDYLNKFFFKAWSDQSNSLVGRFLLRSIKNLDFPSSRSVLLVIFLYPFCDFLDFSFNPYINICIRLSNKSTPYLIYKWFELSLCFEEIKLLMRSRRTLRLLVFRSLLTVWILIFSKFSFAPSSIFLLVLKLLLFWISIYEVKSEWSDRQDTGICKFFKCDDSHSAIFGWLRLLYNW